MKNRRISFLNILFLGERKNLSGKESFMWEFIGFISGDGWCWCDFNWSASEKEIKLNILRKLQKRVHSWLKRYKIIVNLRGLHWSSWNRWRNGISVNYSAYDKRNTSNKKWFKTQFRKFIWKFGSENSKGWKLFKSIVRHRRTSPLAIIGLLSKEKFLLAQSVFTASFTDAFLMQVELHSSSNINGNTRNFVFRCCPHRIRAKV